MFCSFSVEPKNNKISFDVAHSAPFSHEHNLLDRHRDVQDNIIHNFAAGNSDLNNIYNDIDSSVNAEAPKLLPNFSSSARKITGGTKKRKWTSEEDFLLIQAVNTYGVDNWNLVSQRIDNRSGKQCRERWMSNICPTLIKDTWTHQEDLILIQKQSEFGNKWTLIHNFLPGRSNTSIKNRWKCLCRRGGSKHLHEFRQAFNCTPNNVSMAQNCVITQNIRPNYLLNNVQQQQQSTQAVTPDFIDALFDGDCWSEFEATPSLKI